MRSRIHWQTAALVIATAVTTLGVRSAIASQPDVVMSAKGGTVSALQVVSDSAEADTSSATLVDIPGATLSVRVPTTWHAGLIVATFQAECSTFGGLADVRLLIDGTQMQPEPVGAYTAYCYGSAPQGAGPSITRWAGSLSPGVHTVTAQFDCGDCSGGGEAGLDAWILTTERSRSN